jgi:Ca-activated chloride channel family protein
MIANANATPASPAPEITAELDREIINLEGGSVRHLVISVKAPPLPPTDKPQLPINLGLVIDASGSMAGLPIEAAKAAAVALLEKLATTDHLSLVSFASDVVVHAEAVKLDEQGRSDIGRSVRPLVTRGSTNLFGGWVGGCEAVAKRQAAADALERNHVMLLSDGHANQGETDPLQLAHHAGELRKRGVLTSTVGIGSQYSPIQLQAISEAGGGRMHEAELPDEIAEIMFAELTDALATTVENLELTLRLPQGVGAELYGTAPLNRDAEGCEILSGSMIASGLRRIVVKLTFPAGHAGEALPVAVSARWKTPGDAATRSLEVGSVAARFDTPAACLAQPRSRDLARIVAEQWQAHIYHRAMVLNQDGQYEAAHTFAERESRYFDRYCHDLPEMRASIEEVHEFAPTASRAYHAMASKEMFVRSYKIARGETDRRSRARQSLKEIIRSEAARRGGQ